MQNRRWSDWKSYHWASLRTPRRRMLVGVVTVVQLFVGIWLWFTVGHAYFYGLLAAGLLFDVVVGRYWLTQDGKQLLAAGGG